MAEDHGGRLLAVKVQHPGLRETAAADITTVEALVKGVKLLFPVGALFSTIFHQSHFIHDSLISFIPVAGAIRGLGWPIMPPMISTRRPVVLKHLFRSLIMSGWLTRSSATCLVSWTSHTRRPTQR